MGAAGVDTARAEHRALRFNTIDDVLAEVDRLVAADQGGRLRRTGNWTAGQTFGHLASWINYGWEGYPSTVPWFIPLLLRMKLRKMLKEGMPRGVRIPGAEAGTYGVAPLSTTEGAERLRAALRRLQGGEPPKFHSPAFGPMSHEDRIRLNLRHAELHLGYLHPE